MAEPSNTKYAFKWAYGNKKDGYYTPFACKPFTVGTWLPTLDHLEHCVRGYHVPTIRGLHFWRMGGCVLFVVEVDTEGMLPTKGGKMVFRSIKYVKSLGRVASNDVVKKAIERAYAEFGKENFLAY